ncbi:hypothetical protein MRB53_037115 [Persea americana]|nr:hypothetical protein MRB53_037115 [Persea americana]
MWIVRHMVGVVYLAAVECGGGALVSRRCSTEVMAMARTSGMGEVAVDARKGVLMQTMHDVARCSSVRCEGQVKHPLSTFRARLGMSMEWFSHVLNVVCTFDANLRILRCIAIASRVLLNTSCWHLHPQEMGGFPFTNEQWQNSDGNPDFDESALAHATCFARSYGLPRHSG